MRFQALIVGGLGLTLALASRGQAATTGANSQSNTGMNAFAVSGTDLVNNGQPTLTSATPAGFSPYNDGSGNSNVSALGDGSDGSATTKSVETAVTTQGTNWTLTYALNTTTNIQGYSISEIDTVSGWTADFANQKYSLAYSTVSAPGTFINLGTFENDSNIATGNPAVSLKIALTDSGGTIATNVAALQFTFQPDSVRNN